MSRGEFAVWRTPRDRDRKPPSPCRPARTSGCWTGKSFAAMASAMVRIATAAKAGFRRSDRNPKRIYLKSRISLPPWPL